MVKLPQYTSQVIKDGVSSSVNGYVLFQRNSPKYVKVGDYYYSGLNIGTNIIIFKNNNLTGAWSELQVIPNDYVRPPTLLVTGNSLHVIFETSAGNVRHYLFSNANTASPGTPVTVTTDNVWQSGNSYLGGAASTYDGNLYMCSANDQGIGSQFRCGVYKNSVWTVNGLMSYLNHSYIYPNIQPVPGGGAIVDVGLAPKTTVEGSSTIRILNLYFKLSAQATNLGGYSYSPLLGIPTYFNNDIALLPNQDVLIFPVKTISALGQTVTDSIVKSSLLSEYFQVQRDVKTSTASISGSGTTAQTLGSYTYLIGGGQIAKTPDGKLWDIYEYDIPGYPKTIYAYGVAQALQNKGGSAASDKVRFMQELTKISNGVKTILEVVVNY
jgi:hypothetical protein